MGSRSPRFGMRIEECWVLEGQEVLGGKEYYIFGDIVRW